MAQFIYKGIEPISEEIRRAHSRSGWRVHAKKPETGKEPHILRNYYIAYGPKENKVRAFEEWANQAKEAGDTAGALFYLEIYHKGKAAGRPSEILPFRLDDGIAPEPKQTPVAGMGANAESLEALRYEILRLKLEKENLERQLIQSELDEEEEEDEDEEDEGASIFGIPENSETGQALGAIIKHFAGVLTQPKNPVLGALEKIKKAAPEAEALLMQLGTLAEQRPEEFRTFITELQKNFNPNP